MILPTRRCAAWRASSLSRVPWLLAVLLTTSCATPRPSLSGEGDAYLSRQAVRAPFAVSARHAVIDEPEPFEPWSDLEPGAGASRSTQGGESNIMELGYHFYSTYLTQVDGARCEHRPTCSRFARDAIRKHGVLVGSWMTADRLMRTNSSSSLKRLPIAKIQDGRAYYADPVEDNDFFF